MAESGFKDYDVTLWYGLIGPKGLPPEIVSRINAEVNKVLAQKETPAKLEIDGASPAGGTPAQFQGLRKENRHVASDRHEARRETRVIGGSSMITLLSLRARGCALRCLRWRHAECRTDLSQQADSFVVPFRAGGGTDTIARALGESVAKDLGQPIVVDNKGGADTFIGNDASPRVPPTVTRCCSTPARSPSCRASCPSCRMRLIQRSLQSCSSDVLPTSRWCVPTVRSSRRRIPRPGQGASGQVELRVRRQRHFDPPRR